MALSIPVHIVDGQAGPQDDTFESIPTTDRAYRMEPDTGIYVAITTAFEDVVVPIPSEAVAVYLWFAYGYGRIAITSSASPIAGVTATNGKMWFANPEGAYYMIPDGATHLHVTGDAGTVIRGGFAT